LAGAIRLISDYHTSSAVEKAGRSTFGGSPTLGGSIFPSFPLLFVFFVSAACSTILPARITVVLSFKPCSGVARDACAAFFFFWRDPRSGACLSLPQSVTRQPSFPSLCVNSTLFPAEGPNRPWSEPALFSQGEVDRHPPLFFLLNQDDRQTRITLFSRW